MEDRHKKYAIKEIRADIEKCRMDFNNRLQRFENRLFILEEPDLPPWPREYLRSRNREITVLSFHSDGSLVGIGGHTENATINQDDAALIFRAWLTAYDARNRE